MVEIYGIKNCDTMKKAFAWLDAHKVAYVFHDYKKEGADRDVLTRAMAAHGWENVINRKGTTWRALPEDARQGMTQKTALQAALVQPSLVRRPLVVAPSRIILGFDVETYAEAFKK